MFTRPWKDLKKPMQLKNLKTLPGMAPVSRKELAWIGDSRNLQEMLERVNGDVTSAIEKYTKVNPGFRIALLNLDFQADDATMSALGSLDYRVAFNGIVGLDEDAASQ